MIDPLQKKSWLVQRPSYEPELTAVRECDSRTAAVRGLAEYAASLSMSVGSAGKLARLNAVHYEVPSTENTANFPVGYALALGPCEHDGTLTTKTQDLGGGLALRFTGEVSLSITFGVRCADPVSRRVIAAMLEDAFSPVDWDSGFRLVLPHYHGVVCSYLVETSSFVEDESTKSGNRDLDFQIRAQVPKVRWLGKVPALHIDLKTEVE